MSAYAIAAEYRCTSVYFHEADVNIETWLFVPVLILPDGMRYPFLQDGQETKQKALRVAAEKRERWEARRANRLIVIRVDGEIGDALLPDERGDAPSLTDWQRNLDTEAMRDRLR